MKQRKKGETKENGEECEKRRTKGQKLKEEKRRR